MSVLSRSALESSPLADLHEIARELELDGFRRLRKADLVDAILAQQGGDADGGAAEAGVAEAEADAPAETDAEETDAEEKPARRSRRGGRSRSRSRDRDPERDGGDADAEAEAEAEEGTTDEDAGEPAPRRSRRTRGGGSGGRGADTNGGGREAEEEQVVTGRIELLANGSGFVRVDGADDDVYVSAAQVRRCELVDGDEVSGPMRPPRRSERHPSLARVDTINGRAADEVAEGTRYEDLPAAWPTERLELDDDEPTLKAIAWLTPLGRGSRAVLTGPARSGKTEALRRLARVLHAQDDLEVVVVLSGVRPEEVADWKADDLPEPAATVTLGAPGEVLTQALERSAETARRVAARGGHAVLLVDGLQHVVPQQALRVLGAARDIVDGGSLTVIATAPAPLGGETTVIALDVALASTNRFPALDLASSGTLHPELLVGEKGAAAIAEARTAALGG
jgi:transcription termination factor Rho